MNKKYIQLISLISSFLIFLISLIFVIVLRGKIRIDYSLAYYCLGASIISMGGIISYYHFNYKVGELFHLISSIFLMIFFLNQSLMYNLFAYTLRNSFFTFFFATLFDVLLLSNLFFAIYSRIVELKIKLDKKPKNDFFTLLFGGITSGIIFLLLFIYVGKNLSASYVLRLVIVLMITLGGVISSYLYDQKLGKVLSVFGFVIATFQFINLNSDFLQFQFIVFGPSHLILFLFQVIATLSYIIYLSFLFYKNEEVEVTVL